jgi:hypothetical protein
VNLLGDNIIYYKEKGKRPLGRPGRRWVGNIKTYLGEIGWGSMEWIGVAYCGPRYKNRTPVSRMHMSK